MEYTISVNTRSERKVKDTKSIPFGVQPTEHMFIAEYKNGEWRNASIVPYTELTMSPFALCLHYGQTVFEGMKAFMMQNGKVNIFRTDKHYDRFAKSLKRMCMPVVPKGLFMEALHQLVHLDSSWVPEEEDGSLYLRPFVIASEERLGIKAAEEYLFLIVCTPAYQYYAQPLKVKVESEYIRAAEGGTGSTKCGGNYGGALYPTQLAREQGYDQVIWTDAKNHEYIEESGTMNLMFVIDGVLTTPPLSGTILDGVTRDSMLTIAKQLNIPVDVRPISYKELKDALQSGKRIEAFGAGTAAVIAPIKTIGMDGEDYDCYIDEDAIMYELKNELFKIRRGLTEDVNKWNYVI